MAAKLDYQWHLRKVMADRGLFSTTDLIPLLDERGITLSSSQVYRLVVERPERLSLKILMALLDILDCTMDDLIEPVAAAGAGSTARARKAVGACCTRPASPGSSGRPAPAAAESYASTSPWTDCGYAAPASPTPASRSAQAAEPAGSRPPAAIRGGRCVRTAWSTTWRTWKPASTAADERS